MIKYCFILISLLPLTSIASEWPCLKVYQQETGQSVLSEKDWLTSDRRKNTHVWQQANTFNLENQLASEYSTIKQRRDFYQWYYMAISDKGHEVVWPKMAHYISTKLRLTKAFPFTIFTNKSIKSYANQGSETVFMQVFSSLKTLYHSESILKSEAALAWDETILYKEQWDWIQPIYNDIDENTLKTIEKMAKGNGFYSLMVPKAIRFEGDISNQNSRYQYALNQLRMYCKKRYE